MLREDKKAGFRRGFLGLSWRFTSANRQAKAPVNRKEFERATSGQRQAPIQVMQDGGRQWWWYRNRFYWEDDGLSRDDVQALVYDREQRKRQRIENAKTRLLQEGSEPQVTPRAGIPRDVKLRVWERFEGRCANCGSTRLLQFDHIVPLAMGGSNAEQNLQLLCDRCNSEKSGGLAEPSLSQRKEEEMTPEPFPESTEIEAGIFETWQRHRERLRAELGHEATRGADRYRDLMLVTNVMKQQYDQVNEKIQDATRTLAQISDRADPRVEGLTAFANWAEPWLHEFQAEFDRYERERDEARNQLTDSQRNQAETELEQGFNEILDEVKAPLQARHDELTASIRRDDTSADMKACPDCAEQVKAAARKCRYCGYRFDAEEAG
jgi:5-methylcytosine-specific restriction endonuclease McrA